MQNPIQGIALREVLTDPADQESNVRKPPVRRRLLLAFSSRLQILASEAAGMNAPDGFLSVADLLNWA
jgi:hypothetical protein